MRAIAVFACLVSVFGTAAASLPGAGPSDMARPAAPSLLAPHAPIVIMSNTDFTAANGVTQGSGTQSDPYVIENWAIDTSGCPRMHFQDTDKHFVVRNVTTTTGCSDAVWAADFTNGTFQNVTFAGVDKGISFWSIPGKRTSNVRVANSTFLNTTFTAIEVGQETAGQVDNLTISGNSIRVPGGDGVRYRVDGGGVVRDTVIRDNLVEFTTPAGGAAIGLTLGLGLGTGGILERNMVESNTVRNASRGIWFYGGDWNMIAGNSVKDSANHGIQLDGGNAEVYGNVVTGNVVDVTGRAGIYFGDGDRNNDANITGNIVTNTSGAGIYLYNPIGDWVLGNDVRWTGGHGIEVYQDWGAEIDTHLRVEGNVVRNSSRGGIVFGGCCDRMLANTVRNNTVTDSAAAGIDLYGFNDGWVVWNNLSRNWDGILLYSGATGHSRNNLIAWNDADNNTNSGIYVDDSVADPAQTTDNEISGNRVRDNAVYGIKLSNATLVNVSGNTATGNHHGIHLESSSNNVVGNNTVDSNDVGIHLLSRTPYPASGNSVVDNTISANREDGIRLERTSAGAAVDSNALRRNRVTSSGWSGIELWNASSSNITHNTVSGSGTSGIALNGSDSVVDLASGLVAHWRMNESAWTGAAGEVTDSSGSGNHGQAISGATTVAGGVEGRAGSFTTSLTQFVDVPPSSSLNLSAGATVAGWIRLTTFVAPSPLFNYRNVGNSGGYTLELSDPGGLRFFVYVGGGFQNAFSGAGSIPTGVWVHVAGTYDGSKIVVYLNGAALGTTPFPGPITQPPTAPVRAHLGANVACGCGFFDGLMDEMRVYSRAVTPDEVRELAGSPPLNNGNKVVNNSVTANGAAGLLVSGSGALAMENNLSGNAVGFSLSLTSNSTITRNRVGWNAGYGATSVQGSRDNLIHHNNFLSNNGGGTQASDSAGPNRWNDSYPSGGNFWSDHTTPDNCSDPSQSTCGGSPDGIVDNPYAIAGTGGAQDRYPLTNATPGIPELRSGFLASIIISLGLMLAVLAAAASRRRD